MNACYLDRMIEIFSIYTAVIVGELANPIQQLQKDIKHLLYHLN